MTTKKFRYNNDSMLFSDSTDTTKKLKTLKSNDNIDFYETEIDYSKITESSESNLEKRMCMINDFATKKTIDDSVILPTIYLPNKFKRLVKLYKTIVNVYNYNRERKLNLIFAYHKGSLEKLYKHSITIKDLQQLKFLCGETIVYKKIIFREKDTFNITITDEINIENEIYIYLVKKHKEWLHKNNKNYVGKGFHKEFKVDEFELEEDSSLSSMMKMEQKVEFEAHKQYEKIMAETAEKERERRNEYIKGLNGTNEQQIDIKNRSVENIHTNVMIKYEDIMSRVKEREEARRKAFVEQEKECYKIISVVDEIFAVENKKAMKADELMFRIGKGYTEIKLLKILENKYTAKKIKDILYIIKIDVNYK